MHMVIAAAAAKSLQSCPALSDSLDSSLLGSSVQGTFQARVLEWVAIASSDMVTRHMKISSLIIFTFLIVSFEAQKF